MIQDKYEGLNNCNVIKIEMSFGGTGRMGSFTPPHYLHCKSLPSPPHSPNNNLIWLAMQMQVQDKSSNSSSSHSLPGYVPPM